MARDWWNELAGRPGGYAITWDYRVEGPNAQAIYDRMVLEMAVGARVLDCGCGDGAAERGVTNVSYALGHARQTELASSFDLAITRRGPDIRTVVASYVRASGIEENGLRVISCERYLDRFIFPSLNDLAGWLNRQPGLPDVRRPEHHDLLMAKAAEFGTGNGDFAVPMHYIVWLAERL